jgi:hypothetical protein
MISRAAFITIMDSIKTQMDRDYKIGGLITDIGDTQIMGANNRFVYTTFLIDDLIKALSADTDDAFAMISYWIYEVEFGEKADDYFITMPNKEKRYLHSAGHLWDYLLETK